MGEEKDKPPELVYLDGDGDAGAVGDDAFRPPVSGTHQAIDLDLAAVAPVPVVEGEAALAPTITAAMVEPATPVLQGIPIASEPEPAESEPEHAISLVLRLGLWLLVSIAAVLASLFPEWTRRRLRLDRLPLAFGTTVSAVVQLGLVIFLAGFLYHAYAQRIYEFAVHVYMESDAPNKRAFAMGLGGANFIGFLFFSPTGWGLLYFFTESLLRFAAGMAAGKPLATLPLWLVERLGMLGFAAYRRIRLGPIVADQVAVEGNLLIIATCRPREWSGKTIEYQGKLYRVTSVDQRARERRGFRYRLEPPPPGYLVRRIHHYSPAELLPDPDQSWWRQLGRAVRALIKKQRPEDN